ncbi:uncharacterized protein LOC106011888 [Aplysia californica]|uniref:Uncharacterized protein LOC106011888 n=1 Tax=Aplysia californica TaxID=6500 RepID=A0ABM1A0T2_APLCA|nr:uncharacterized protein LOC106011888 [Aplysia californica]
MAAADRFCGWWSRVRPSVWLLVLSSLELTNLAEPVAQVVQRAASRTARLSVMGLGSILLSSACSGTRFRTEACQTMGRTHCAAGGAGLSCAVLDLTQGILGQLDPGRSHLDQIDGATTVLCPRADRSTNPLSRPAREETGVVSFCET